MTIEGINLWNIDITKLLPVISAINDRCFNAVCRNSHKASQEKGHIQTCITPSCHERQYPCNCSPGFYVQRFFNESYVSNFKELVYLLPIGIPIKQEVHDNFGTTG